MYLFYQPITIVLPHHNLVQTNRQKFLKSIASRRLLTRQIILIGPDHFSPNQRQITTADKDWSLSTGTFTHSHTLNLPIDNFLLSNDHAIYNPLADLKTYFPKASVQPILIGQKVSPEALANLLASLESNCGFDCLLVFSVDFSHYLPATLAQVHDAYTLAQLQNLDDQKILKAEVDSPQSLYLLTKFARFKNALHWQLFDHTNSGIMVNNPDIETTTHIFGSYSFGRLIPNFTKTQTISPGHFDRDYGVDDFIVDSNSKYIISTINNQVVSSFPISHRLFSRFFDVN